MLPIALKTHILFPFPENPVFVLTTISLVWFNSNISCSELPSTDKLLKYVYRSHLVLKMPAKLYNKCCCKFGWFWCYHLRHMANTLMMSVWNAWASCLMYTLLLTQLVATWCTWYNDKHIKYGETVSTIIWHSLKTTWQG